MASKGVLLGINTAKKVLRMTGASDGEYPPSEVKRYEESGSTSLFKATMKAAWSAGVANCDIYSINGTTFTDTGIDANVYDGLLIFSALTTGNHLLVLLQDSKYYAIQAPCPA